MASIANRTKAVVGETGETISPSSPRTRKLRHHGCLAARTSSSENQNAVNLSSPKSSSSGAVDEGSGEAISSKHITRLVRFSILKARRTNSTSNKALGISNSEINKKEVQPSQQQKNGTDKLSKLSQSKQHRNKPSKAYTKQISSSPDPPYDAEMDELLAPDSGGDDDNHSTNTISIDGEMSPSSSFDVGQEVEFRSTCSDDSADSILKRVEYEIDNARKASIETYRRINYIRDAEVIPADSNSFNMSEYGGSLSISQRSPIAEKHAKQVDDMHNILDVSDPDVNEERGSKMSENPIDENFEGAMGVIGQEFEDTVDIEVVLTSSDFDSDDPASPVHNPNLNWEDEGDDLSIDKHMPPLDDEEFSLDKRTFENDSNNSISIDEEAISIDEGGRPEDASSPLNQGKSSSGDDGSTMTVDIDVDSDGVPMMLSEAMSSQKMSNLEEEDRYEVYDGKNGGNFSSSDENDKYAVYRSENDPKPREYGMSDDDDQLQQEVRGENNDMEQDISDESLTKNINVDDYKDLETPSTAKNVIRNVQNSSPAPNTEEMPMSPMSMNDDNDDKLKELLGRVQKLVGRVRATTDTETNVVLSPRSQAAAQAAQAASQAASSIRSKLRSSLEASSTTSDTRSHQSQSSFSSKLLSSLEAAKSTGTSSTVLGAERKDSCDTNPSSFSATLRSSLAASASSGNERYSFGTLFVETSSAYEAAMSKSDQSTPKELQVPKKDDTTCNMTTGTLWGSTDFPTSAASGTLWGGADGTTSSFQKSKYDFVGSRSQNLNNSDEQDLPIRTPAELIETLAKKFHASKLTTLETTTATNALSSTTQCDSFTGTSKSDGKSDDSEDEQAVAKARNNDTLNISSSKEDIDGKSANDDFAATASTRTLLESAAKLANLGAGGTTPWSAKTSGSSTQINVETKQNEVLEVENSASLSDTNQIDNYKESASPDDDNNSDGMLSVDDVQKTPVNTKTEQVSPAASIPSFKATELSSGKTPTVTEVAGGNAENFEGIGVNNKDSLVVGKEVNMNNNAALSKNNTESEVSCAMSESSITNDKDKDQELTDSPITHTTQESVDSLAHSEEKADNGMAMSPSGSGESKPLTWTPILEEAIPKEEKAQSSPELLQQIVDVTSNSVVPGNSEKMSGQSMVEEPENKTCNIETATIEPSCDASTVSNTNSSTTPQIKNHYEGSRVNENLVNRVRLQRLKLREGITDLDDHQGIAMKPSKDDEVLSRKIRFSDPYPTPTPAPRPRAARDIIRDHSNGSIEPFNAWKQPNAELKDLLRAAVDTSLTRRSNACGALKVITQLKKNKFVLVRTEGFLKALVFAASAEISAKNADLSRDARTRAIASLFNVSNLRDNRAIVFSQPGLSECLVKVISQDQGEARLHACGTLAQLAKSPACREDLVKVENLVPVLADVLRGTIDPMIEIDETRDTAATKEEEKKMDDDDFSHDVSEEMVRSSSYSEASSTASSTNGHSDKYQHKGSKRTSIRQHCQRHKQLQSGVHKNGHDKYFQMTRLSACAALLHLSKHCSVTPTLCSFGVLNESLVEVSQDIEAPLHSKCLEILCNLTRFPANNKILSRFPGLLNTLIASGRSKYTIDRVWAMQALQNLSADASSKAILGTSVILTLLIGSVMSDDVAEQRAALGTLFNISTEPSAVVPMTSTRNVVATLVHFAHKPDAPSDVRMMACNALATIGLWLQTVSGFGTVPPEMENLPLPTHSTCGWHVWD